MRENKLPLRDYQRAAIDAVSSAWDRGIKRPAVVLPTGVGKTVILSHLVRERMIAQGMIGKALVIVHREELITQTVSKLHDVAPNLRVGVVKASRNEINGYDVIVASIQTIRKPERLEQLRGIGLVIVDECHHAAADSYVSVMNALSDHALFVGFTATMDREDKNLADVWSEVVYTRDVLDMIPEYLVDVQGRMVTIDGMSLNQAKVTRGDYSDSSLSDLLLDAGAQEIVAESYKTHASDRKGLLFAPTVKAAQAFSDALNKVGIKSAVVHGSMPDEERKLVIKRFIKGDVQVICNCMVLTEGFDVPEASCCVIARPTRSASLYVQMVGRVLRPFPGKVDALVLDVVGASEDHTLATLADLSSKRVDKVEPGETLTGAARRLKKAGHPALAGYVDHIEVDLFKRSSSMWSKTDAGLWFISTKDELFFLWPGNEVGKFNVGRCPIYASGGSWIQRNVSLMAGMAWAEEAAKEADQGFITNRKASWRKRNEPPTAGQIRYAAKLGLALPSDITKGALSDMITRKVASRRLDSKLKSD
jgi:superfamily II DNA or RNA helicase